MIKILNKCCFLAVGISMVLLGCSEDQPKVSFPAPTSAAKVMDPFRYHKMLEVSPGQFFDVLSWGRGSTQTGSLLILHSDSAAKKFTTTTGDLEGAIVDVFNADMDIDGNPELLISAKAKDTIDYTRIYAYEFNDNNVNKLDFPKLSSTQKKGYRGLDNFYMKEGKLIREFPIYTGNTDTAKATGAKRVLQYNLRSNSLTVKDLSADTLKLAGTPIKTEEPAAKKVEEKKEEKKSTTKKSSKKKKETPKKKKRRRR